MIETKAETSERLSPEEVEALDYLPICAAMKKWADLDIEKLTERLQDVCEHIEKNGGVRAAYAGSLRTAYVTLQCLLNEKNAQIGQGVAAPAFRQRLKLTNRPVSREKDLSNDTQVIDLNYFWFCGHRGCVHYHGEKAFRSAFDFNSAYRFVRTAGSTELKLELLGLKESVGDRLVRLGATSLRLPKDYELQRQIVIRRNSVNVALKTARIANRANKHLWTTLVLADEWLTKIGLELSNQNLNCIVAIITGEAAGPEKRLMDKLRSAKSAIGRS